MAAARSSPRPAAVRRVIRPLASSRRRTVPSRYTVNDGIFPTLTSGRISTRRRTKGSIAEAIGSVGDLVATGPAVGDASGSGLTTAGGAVGGGTTVLRRVSELRRR